MLSRIALRMKFLFGNRNRKRVLYVGQCYYNFYYLSRALRDLGWKAEVLNWDTATSSQMYYHGEDFSMRSFLLKPLLGKIIFYIFTLWKYDIFHFANTHGILFGPELWKFFVRYFGPNSEIRLLKTLGKKIVYTNNGCLDGVSQTSFSKWGPESPCSICSWRNHPEVCSDSKNLSWGKFRNEVADYQCILGGNRIDYNVAPNIHEEPEGYCLDPDFWRPDLEIPTNFLLKHPPGTVLLYHAVGNFDTRRDTAGKTIKSTHIYLPLIQSLKEEGHQVELIFCTNTPNREVRYTQAQAHIFLEMLTFGWYGANAREALMLGKPVVCFLRPEWLEFIKIEIPEFVSELPIVSATPETVRDKLIELITSPNLRADIGRKSREFAVKWHSMQAGARRFDHIYRSLLEGQNPERHSITPISKHSLLPSHDHAVLHDT